MDKRLSEEVFPKPELLLGTSSLWKILKLLALSTSKKKDLQVTETKQGFRLLIL